MTRLSTLAQLRRISHRGARHGSQRRARCPRTGDHTEGNRLQWAALAAASLPGIAALAALLFTWVSVEQSGEQLRIAERGQVTGRFNAAIGNLSSSAVDVRLGGIYGLERLMRDSPHDHPTVVTLLTAYVREHTHGQVGGSADARPAADVQAAMTVLANRDPTRDGRGDFNLRNVRLRNLGYMGMWDRARQRVIGINFHEADFSDADLRSADLEHAHLAGAVMARTTLQEAALNQAELADADLTDADLNRSHLKRANLRRIKAAGAHFDETDLTRAVLEDARLQRASLVRASLPHAILRGADLRQVDLRDADFTGADLSGADFTGAKNLSTAEFEGAVRKGTRGLPS
ncbi:pentapeptide repeat-containing protein [Streptomyces violaceus]|uniref:Pentapeptide repeat-containing protein n=1 Tax=Streptomyces violaceus TaxID=1936 RepID=A0ABY9UAE2_STRVL|nr:pentapeptide repeat-containing protein [Streptomyces janthinus]WND19847.1 pentapeptide repeat-containing protein [Streptomyces janthinus]